MTKEKTFVWCNNGTESFQLIYGDYIKLIESYKEKYDSKEIFYSYKNHNYKINFIGFNKNNLYFCGYVENVPDDTTYNPWGGFTGGSDNYSGFDCAHCNDFYGTTNTNTNTNEHRTFKTEEFVHLECQKIIDNVFDI